jgi:hypothetical protein
VEKKQTIYALKNDFMNNTLYVMLVKFEQAMNPLQNTSVKG